MADEKIYPIPEALQKGPWDVQAGTANRTTNGLMVVPLTSDLHDMVVRTHEMAHAKWSPKDPAEIPRDVNPAVLSAVEDARVNALAMNAKADLSPGFDPRVVGVITERLVEKKDWDSLALLAVSTSSVPGTREIVGAAMASSMPRKIQAAVASVAERIYNKPSSFDTTITTARWLEKRLGQIHQEEKDKEESEAKSSIKRIAGTTTAVDHEMDKRLGEDKKEMEKLTGGLKMDEVMRPGFIKPYWMEGHASWGKLSVIEEPERPNRLPGRMGRRLRATDTGAALVFPQRLMQDGRVFARKQQAYGATVLVDGSGSMSLTADQVWQILMAAPGATVAIYSGNGYSGGLRILAKNGTYVNKEWVRGMPFGGGNIVDYPALKWAAKGDEPRIWISDGQVTGVNDSFHHGNQVECFELCVRARILRLPNPTEAIKHLQKIKRLRQGAYAA